MPTPSKQSIVVLTTSVGEDLVIRSGPTAGQVRAFVTEAHKRFKQGKPAGADPTLPAYEIFSAKRYDNELDWLLGTDEGTKLKIEDLLT